MFVLNSDKEQLADLAEIMVYSGHNNIKTYILLKSLSDFESLKAIVSTGKNKNTQLDLKRKPSWTLRNVDSGIVHGLNKKVE